MMLRLLKTMGFKFELVLADSLYGENDTNFWWIMTKIPGVKYSQVGNAYGLRTWVKYGLKQSKNELGWADFRLTDYGEIQKWWELVCSAYLMVSMHSEKLGHTSGELEKIYAENPEWDEKLGWKNLLNNLRLILEPFVYSNRIKSWLKMFPIPELEQGLLQLIALMNGFGKRLDLPSRGKDFYFSSA